MRKNYFHIATLQSRHRSLKDPVTILTGGVALLSQLFPNIFGGSRKRLTDADWTSLIPGSGYYSTSLRNYLKTRIHYDTDFTQNVLPFSQQFAYNQRDLNGGFCNGCSNEAAYSKLLSVLKQEQQTGGNSPIGPTPGGFGGTLDYSTLMPLAIGAIALVILMKSKKKK